MKSKYRIYIDEVGNNDLRSSDDFNHRYLSLTGLIFELEYMKNTVNPCLEELKKKFFPHHHPDEPLIFHRKELINKKYPFHNLKDKEIEKRFNEELLKTLNTLDYVVISVLIDKKNHNEKYLVWKYDPYHYCMEIIVERFFFFLVEKDGIGDVMVESRGGKEDARLKDSFSRIYQNGTHFIDAGKIKERLTSKELKVKPKTLNISGLQLADLIAHPSRRYMFKYYKINDANSRVFGDEIITIIQNKYYRGRNGEIEGYGIKLLP